MLVLLQLLVLSTNPALDEGRRFYAALKWERAEQQLRLACDVPSATSEERYEAYDLLARTLLASGRADAAVETYAKLLSLAPMAAEPTHAAPKIRDAFRRAKEGLFRKGYVLVRQLPSAPDRLELQVVDPWGSVAELVFLSSAEDTTTFEQRALASNGGQASVDLQSATPGRALRWYAVARAADGRVLSELGSSEAPLVWRGPARSELAQRVEVKVAPSPPVVRPRWVPWALSGLAVVAAGAGVALGVFARADADLARSQRWGSDAVSLSTGAQGAALGANFAYGGAALSAVTAAILFWVW